MVTKLNSKVSSMNSLKDINAIMSQYTAISLFSKVINTCTRDLALPALVTCSSLLFSISTTLMIVHKEKIFYSAVTMFVPFIDLEGIVILIVATRVFAEIYTKSLDMNAKYFKFLTLSQEAKYLRRKKLSLQPMKIYISQCFFDKEMPLTTADNTISNTISLLVAIKYD